MRSCKRPQVDTANRLFYEAVILFGGNNEGVGKIRQTDMQKCEQRRIIAMEACFCDSCASFNQMDTYTAESIA